MKLVKFGEDVVKDYENLRGNGVAIDPATILIIMDVVVKVIDMLQSCKQNPDDVVKMTSSPSIFQRIVLRRVVKDVLGNREYRNSGTELVDSILSNAKKLNTDDVKEMFQDAQEEE
jgi:hypothetical protein